MCEVSLSAQEMSPTGRLTDRFTPHCTGQVILDGGEGNLGDGFSDFPIRMDDCRRGLWIIKRCLDGTKTAAP